jgi:hypothetical protein
VCLHECNTNSERYHSGDPDALDRRLTWPTTLEPHARRRCPGPRKSGEHRVNGRPVDFPDFTRGRWKTAGKVTLA